jgi:hypothetical protein
MFAETTIMSELWFIAVFVLYSALNYYRYALLPWKKFIASLKLNKVKESYWTTSQNQIIFHPYTLIIPPLESPQVNKLLYQLNTTIHGRLQLRLKTCKVWSSRTSWRSIQCRKRHVSNRSCVFMSLEGMKFLCVDQGWSHASDKVQTLAL